MQLLWMIFLFLFVPVSTWAIVPVSILNSQADAIVFGEAAALTILPDGSAEFHIIPRYTLKGNIPAGSLTATLHASSLMKQHASRNSQVGVARFGIWFLAVRQKSITILPTERPNYTESAAFIPLPESWVVSSSVSIEQLLLQALLDSYQGTIPHSRHQEGMLLAGIRNVPRGVAISFVQDMINKGGSNEAEGLGITAAIAISSPDALSLLTDRIQSLRQDGQLNRIADVLENEYRPTGESSVRQLRALILLRIGEARFDSALARATSKLPIQDALPLMALLLDSPEDRARMAAVHFFYTYTTLAGEDGLISSSDSGIHPLSTEETRRNSGNSAMPLEAQVAFWKSWLAQQRIGESNP